MSRIEFQDVRHAYPPPSGQEPVYALKQVDQVFAGGILGGSIAHHIIEQGRRDGCGGAWEADFVDRTRRTIALVRAASVYGKCVLGTRCTRARPSAGGVASRRTGVAARCL